MPELRIVEPDCVLEVNCSDDPDAPEWTPVITATTDPRNDIPYPPPFPDPPPEGQTNECLSAANIAEWVWYVAGQFAIELDTFTFLAPFLTRVMEMIATLFSVAVDLILDDTITFMADIDEDTILADFGSLDKQDFIDLIVCRLNPDGSFPASEWGDFLTALGTMGISNQGWLLVRYVCLITGWGGVNLAARIGGITEAVCDDCLECDWSVELDFTEGMHGFVAWDSGGGARATYVAGQGWTANFAVWGCAAQIERAVAFDCVKVELFATAPAECWQLQAPSGGSTTEANVVECEATTSKVMVVGALVTGLWLSHGYGYPEPCSSAGGYTQYLTKAIICGNGTNPFE